MVITDLVDWEVSGKAFVSTTLASCFMGSTISIRLTTVRERATMTAMITIVPSMTTTMREAELVVKAVERSFEEVSTKTNLDTNC